MSASIILAEYGNRDLVRVVDNRCLPAGRLPTDALEVPPGLDIYDNRRRNKYWALYEGQVVLLVLDPPTP